jgi:Gpi18-like mannosyltransferase
MELSKKRSAPALQIFAYGALGILFLLAIALRISLFPIQTSDYTFFLSQWYDFIQSHGGFAAFKYNFANYNVPYLYLLAITTYLPIPKLIAIKSISVAFDIVLGIFTYLIINLKYKRSIAAAIGALVVLFAPTIFINSSAWGQCDAIYTAFCLGSLYYALKERPALACVFFGLAISFKLQAIFFLPVLLVLLLKRKLSLKHLILIPAIFLLLLVPAFIAGRDAGSLLTIYVGQVNTGGVGAGAAGQFGGRGFNNGNPPSFNGRGTGHFNGRGAGAFPAGNGGGGFTGGGRGQGGASSSSLTLNAPTIYQWLPAGTPEYWKWLGIAFAALVVLGVGILVWRSKKQLTPAIILKIALVFALLIPFLLPEMHERYFYLADVLSIIYAFYFPRYFFVAIIMQLCSLLSYAPYMLQRQVVDLKYVAIGVLIIGVCTLVDLVFALRSRPGDDAQIPTGASLETRP